jgi:hypothetical protein
MKKILLITAAFLGCLGVQAQTAGTVTESFTISSASCTTAAPCLAQLYKHAGACPAGTPPVAVPSTFTLLAGSLVLQSNGNFTDVDSTLVVGQSYCYLATVTYETAGAAVGPPSAASTYFAVNIPFPTPAAPALVGSPY